MSITESTSISSGPCEFNDVNQLLRVVDQIGEGIGSGAAINFQVRLKKDSDPHYEIATTICFNEEKPNDDTSYLTSATVVRDCRQMEAFLKQLVNDHPTAMMPSIRFCQSSTPDSKSVVQLFSILVSNKQIMTSNTLWGFLSLPSAIVTNRLRKAKVLQPRSLSSGFISQTLSSLSTELSSKSKSMGSLKTLINKSEKGVMDIASPLTSLFGKKKKSFSKEGAQIPIDNSALSAHLKTATDEESRSLAMLKSAELQFKKNLESTMALTNYILSSTGIGWDLLSVSLFLRKVVKCFHYDGRICNTSALVWTTSSPASGSSSSITTLDVARGTFQTLANATEGSKTTTQLSVDTASSIPHFNKTTQRLYKIVNPAPTHRVRSQPSRDSEIKCELETGGVLMIDSVIALSNGETWGFTPEHVGWTLMEERGGLKYLEINQETPDYDKNMSITIPKYLRTVSATGKLREVAVVDQSNGFFKIHFLGFSPSHNEWISETSSRIDSTLTTDLDDLSESVLSSYGGLAFHHIRQTDPSHSSLKYVEMLTNSLHSSCERLHAVSKGRLDEIKSLYSSAEEDGWTRSVDSTVNPVDVAAQLNEETQKDVLLCWEQHKSTRGVVRENLAKGCREFVHSQYDAKCKEVELLEATLNDVNTMLDQFTDDDPTDALLSLVNESLPPKPPTVPQMISVDISKVTNIMTPYSVMESWSDFLSPQNARCGEVVTVDGEDFEIDLFGGFIKPTPPSPMSGKKSDSSLEYRPGTPLQPSVTDSEPNDSPSHIQTSAVAVAAAAGSVKDAAELSTSESVPDANVTSPPADSATAEAVKDVPVSKPDPTPQTDPETIQPKPVDINVCKDASSPPPEADNSSTITTTIKKDKYTKVTESNSKVTKSKTTTEKDTQNKVTPSAKEVPPKKDKNPSECKPVETKESKPAASDCKQSEGKSTEKKVTATNNSKPTKNKVSESKPSASEPTENKTSESKSTSSKGKPETKPSESKIPTETKPTKGKSAESKPTEAKVAKSNSKKPEPVSNAPTTSKTTPTPTTTTTTTKPTSSKKEEEKPKKPQTESKKSEADSNNTEETKTEQKSAPEVPKLEKVPSKKKVIKKGTTPRMTPRAEKAVKKKAGEGSPDEIFKKHLSARMMPLEFDDSLIEKDASPPSINSSRKATAGSRLASAWDDL
eukprot:TRINITY_DN1486_c1_g1_i1.p1 TRINITY_DN1486_c1_g1~~TRINITY_DN1486_c1_g1_i1.p1  ORF type:complete len:1173 (+),score=264.10 TRINITY_DN1486_c1_g1_i1:104-3622(+)